jgi:CspA family cold shock protein
MASGTIKKLVHDKGFGFIAAEEGTDVFFHHSSVADRGFDSLQEGQRVEYQVDNNGNSPKGKGPRASKVTPM